MRPTLSRGEMGKIWFAGKRGSYRAKVYYRDHLGNRFLKTRSAGTKTEAAKLLRQAVGEELSRSMGVGTGLTGSTSVSAALDLWLADVERKVKLGTRSPTTVDTYRKNITKHIRPAVGDLQLCQMNVAVLDAYLQRCHAEAGYSTAKTSKTILSGLCALATRYGVLTSNPIRDVAPLERGRVKARKSLTEENVVEWLNVLDSSAIANRWDIPLLVRVCLATGLRIGEVLAIRWDDVDFESGMLVVDHTIVRVTGQGLVRKQTKTSSSERELVLPTWCLKLLEDRFDKLRPSDLETPVFGTRNGSWRDPSNTARVIREVREGTDFDWVTNHTHRRTLATLLDNHGLSARAIADQLGHSRPSMTQDVYMGRTRRADAAASILNRVLKEIARDETTEK